MIERALGRKSQTGGKSSLKIVLWRSGGKLTSLLPFSGQHGTDMFSSVMRVVCVCCVCSQPFYRPHRETQTDALSSPVCDSDVREMRCDVAKKKKTYRMGIYKWLCVCVCVYILLVNPNLISP